MRFTVPLVALGLSLGGCSAANSPLSARYIVSNLGDEEFLRLRSGPGLGNTVVMGLPEGTELRGTGCQLEGSVIWCAVSLASTSAVSGFVVEDYLTLLP